MEQDKTKNLLINILTAAVVVGVAVAGYFVFMKTDTTSITGVAAPATSVAVVAEETTAIGNEIDSTVRNLGDLERAVASSKVIFDLPAFKNLEDFSVEIPGDTVGRVNPFVPTVWKIKMKALEASLLKKSSSASAPASSQSASALDTTTATSSASLFGNFSGGI